MRKISFFVCFIIAFTMVNAMAANDSRLGEKKEKLIKIWGAEGEDKIHPDGSVYTEWKKTPFAIQAFFTPVTNVCYMLFVSRKFDPEKKTMTRDEALELVKQFTGISFRLEKNAGKNFYLKRNNIIAHFRWEDYAGMCLNITDTRLGKINKEEWAKIRKAKEQKEAKKVEQKEAKQKSDAINIIKDL